MDKGIYCECGHQNFWLFVEYARCTNCYSEYKVSGRKGKRELWMRRFNREKNSYGKNWEKAPGAKGGRNER